MKIHVNSWKFYSGKLNAFFFPNSEMMLRKYSSLFFIIRF